MSLVADDASMIQGRDTNWRIYLLTINVPVVINWELHIEQFVIHPNLDLNTQILNHVRGHGTMHGVVPFSLTVIYTSTYIWYLMIVIKYLSSVSYV